MIQFLVVFFLSFSRGEPSFCNTNLEVAYEFDPSYLGQTLDVSGNGRAVVWPLSRFDEWLAAESPDNPLALYDLGQLSDDAGLRGGAAVVRASSDNDDIRKQAIVLGPDRWNVPAGTQALTVSLQVKVANLVHGTQGDRILTKSISPAGARQIEEEQGRNIFGGVELGASEAQFLVVGVSRPHGTEPGADTGMFQCRLRTDSVDLVQSTRMDIATEPLFNRWHHVSCVYDGSTLTTHVNGLAVGSRSLSGNVDLSSDWPLVLGAQPYFDRGSSCTVDEIYIWSAALTEEQLEAVGRGDCLHSQLSAAAFISVVCLVTVGVVAAASVAALVILRRRRRGDQSRSTTLSTTATAAAKQTNLSSTLTSSAGSGGSRAPRSRRLSQSTGSGGGGGGGGGGSRSAKSRSRSGSRSSRATAPSTSGPAALVKASLSRKPSRKKMYDSVAPAVAAAEKYDVVPDEVSVPPSHEQQQHYGRFPDLDDDGLGGGNSNSYIKLTLAHKQLYGQVGTRPKSVYESADSPFSTAAASASASAGAGAGAGDEPPYAQLPSSLFIDNSKSSAAALIVNDEEQSVAVQKKTIENVQALIARPLPGPPPQE